MVWGPERNRFKRLWSIHKGPSHHLLVPSQYMGGGPWVKGIRVCSGGREKEGGGLFWGSHLNFFGEKCPVGMASHPKEVRAGTT